MTGNRTTFLVPSPSFLEGVGRVFDFGGILNQYNRTRSPEDADRIALQMDFEAVADDLRTAISLFEQRHSVVRKRQ